MKNKPTYEIVEFYCPFLWWHFKCYMIRRENEFSYREREYVYYDKEGYWWSEGNSFITVYRSKEKAIKIINKLINYHKPIDYNVVYSSKDLAFEDPLVQKFKDLGYNK